MLSESQEQPWLLNAALTPAPRRPPPAAASGAQGAVRQPVRAAHDRKRASLRHAGVGRDRRHFGPDGTPQTVRGTRARRGRRDRLPGPAENRIPIGAAEFGLDWDIARGTLRVPFQDQFRRDAHHAARRIRGARDSPALQLAVRGWRRADRARSVAGRRRRRPGAQARCWCAAPSIRSGSVSPSIKATSAPRSSAAATQRRQYRAVGQFRFRRRAAPRARHRRQPDAGRGAQAAVAGVHRTQGARLGGAAHHQRHGGADRDRDQHDGGRDAAQRAAGPRRRSVDRHRRQNV